MKLFLGKSIEDVKTYWDNRPCNVRHSSKEIGSKDYFDEVEAKRYFVEPHNKEFASFETWYNKKVLEIGCGIGTDTINFARAGAKVVAIDLSEKSIEIAKKRAKVFGVDKLIDFRIGSAENLEDLLLSNEKFDLIYSFGVIHHTPNPENVYSKICRFLNEGGECRLMVYHKMSWKVLEILFKSKNYFFEDIDKSIAKYSEAQAGCPVTFSYTKKEFISLLAKYGIKTDKIYVRHIFPWNIEMYIKGQYEKKWYWKLVPNLFFDLLQKNFGWHICIVGSKS